LILKKGITLLLLLATLAVHVYAQSDSGFDISKAPQWVQDLRRWEIITFGSFPFAMFTATFAMDMYRWVNNNSMDFSEAGRRYAPWPLKSTGAPAMDRHEQELTIAVAAGLSVAVAIADYIIVKVKREKARKRAEALPSGTLIITREPLFEEPPEASPDMPHADDIDGFTDDFTDVEPASVP
jgi:hypothetical protein